MGKRFGPMWAVRGLDLEVAAGEVVGLAGPNGVGKTTTLRMASGLTTLTEGDVTVLGTSPAHGRALRGRVGALIGEPALYPALTPMQHLQATLLTMGRKHDPSRARALLESLDLMPHARKRASQLSSGSRRRLAIAVALVGHPAVILLDEPTSGLDPTNATLARSAVRAAADDGAAVLMSSHVASDITRVCDRVVALAGDGAHREASPHDLSSEALVVQLARSERVTGVAALAAAAIAHQPHERGFVIAAAHRREALAVLASEGIFPVRLVPQHDALELLLEDSP